MISYKVTIKNWSEHNKKSKKSFEYFMLSKGFFRNEKVAKLRPIDIVMYIYCLSICADMNSDCFSIDAAMLPKYLRIQSAMLQQCLFRLELFQLLTAEKNEVLMNRNEMNRNEMNRNRKEVKHPKDVSKENEKKLQRNNPELNALIFKAYSDAYFLRYNVLPLKNAANNSKISQLAKRLGTQAVDVVKFYLTHNDQYYIKTTHSLGGCLSNAESLLTQFLRGKSVTGHEARTAEKIESNISQAEMFRRMSEQV